MFTTPMTDSLAAARRADFMTAGRAARLGRRVRHTVPHIPGSRRSTVKRVAAVAQI